MLGWKLLRESEIALRQQLNDVELKMVCSQLNAAREYIAKCERLIEHERERIDNERERADRIADSLFQSNGLPATSATVLQEQKAADAIADDKRVNMMKELTEIWGETENDLVEDGAEPLPEPLAEIAPK